jgi:hypothetical protein
MSVMPPRLLRRAQGTRYEAREYAKHLNDRGVPAEVAWHSKHGYVCNVQPPWYQTPVGMRSWDDVQCLLRELWFTGVWSDDDDESQGDGGGDGRQARPEGGGDVDA